VRGLVVLLLACFFLSLAALLVTYLGLTGKEAQGAGKCWGVKVPEFPLRGKWDDADSGTYLNWYVCEVPEGNVPTMNESMGWSHFRNSWYKAFCGWHRYEVAAKMCSYSEDGAKLVSISDEAENHFVANLCGFESCWIGLHEQEHTEQWLWEDGTSVGDKSNWKVYTNWNTGEPNNNNGAADESVALMNLYSRVDMPSPGADAGMCDDIPRNAPTGTGKWFDLPEDFRVIHTICEMPLSTSCAEFGWSIDTDEKSCYINLCVATNYVEAQALCKKQHPDSHLVSISSNHENQFVRRICGKNTCRIGLRRNEKGDWRWEDNTVLGKKQYWQGFVNWDDGSPDNEWPLQNGNSVNAGVMNGDDLVPAIRKALVFRRSHDAATIMFEIVLITPLALMAGVSIAAHFNSACLASLIRSISGILIGLWVFVIPHIDSSWPAGSQRLVRFLCVVIALKVALYCTVSHKAQELQWATTVGFNAMGVRSVGDIDSSSAVSLSEVHAQPARDVVTAP
jgi:hypothetical protein